MLQYNAMQKGVFAVLLAKRQAIAAGQAYVESQHDYWSARGEMELLLQGASPKSATAVAGAPQIQSSTPKDTH
jgi:cobalt-zinc-cadmium efflux system outer membrane protein